jgi:hypothetical protein
MYDTYRPGFSTKAPPKVAHSPLDKLARGGLITPPSTRGLVKYDPIPRVQGLQFNLLFLHLRVSCIFRNYHWIAFQDICPASVRSHFVGFSCDEKNSHPVPEILPVAPGLYPHNQPLEFPTPSFNFLHHTAVEPQSQQRPSSITFHLGLI